MLTYKNAGQLAQLLKEEKHFLNEYIELIDGYAAAGGAQDDRSKRVFLNQPHVREIAETLDNRRAAIRRIAGHDMGAQILTLTSRHHA